MTENTRNSVIDAFVAVLRGDYDELTKESVLQTLSYYATQPGNKNLVALKSLSMILGLLESREEKMKELAITLLKTVTDNHPDNQHLVLGCISFDLVTELLKKRNMDILGVLYNLSQHSKGIAIAQSNVLPEIVALLKEDPDTNIKVCYFTMKSWRIMNLFAGQSGFNFGKFDVQ